MMIYFRIAQEILLAAIDLKIVAVLVETATIIVIDGEKRVVIVQEGVVMYVAQMLPN